MVNYIYTMYKQTFLNNYRFIIYIYQLYDLLSVCLPVLLKILLIVFLILLFIPPIIESTYEWFYF